MIFSVNIYIYTSRIPALCCGSDSFLDYVVRELNVENLIMSPNFYTSILIKANNIGWAHFKNVDHWAHF